MSKTVNKDGEIKVTKTDVSELETTTRSTEELLELLLQEAYKINLQLSEITGEVFDDEDV